MRIFVNHGIDGQAISRTYKDLKLKKKIKNSPMSRPEFLQR